jgi:5S rRNA maturation endonuclease (ribonuclease M5)
MGAFDTGFPANGREMMDAVLEWTGSVNSFPGEALLLVEGKKDLSALKELGISQEISILNKGVNLFDLISSISTGDLRETGSPFEGTIIILTDWDRKGGMLASRLKKACLHLDVRFDLDLRREIASLTGKWIKDIESIPAFLSHLDL